MGGFWQDVLGALILFAPAGIANTAPVWVVKIPRLAKFNQPLDLGKTYRGKRVFGENKTIRGLLSGVVVGALTAALLSILIHTVDWIGDADLAKGQINFILLGALSGFGALVGDALESFVKRQLGVAPGKPWIPFDQIDYIIGGMVFVALFIDLEPIHYILIFIMYTLIHPVLSYTAYLLKLKKDPF